jgi:hypothetical protein
MNKKLVSAVLFMMAVIGAVISCVLIFNHFDTVWWEWWPVYFLSVSFFLVGSLVWISALLVENKN